MTEKIAPALDPAAYVAMSAALVAGGGDPLFLAKQTDELLSSCQAGDYTVLIRHHNSLVISSQLTAHQALQRAQQCTSPVEYKQWLLIAQDAQKIADAATRQVAALTDTQEKLKPYHNQNLIRAMAMAQPLVDEREVERRVRAAVAEERLRHKPLPVSDTKRLQTGAEIMAESMRDDWKEFGPVQVIQKAPEEEQRPSKLFWSPDKKPNP